MSQRFFTKELKNTDPEVANILQKELKRQQNSIELIASENIVSKAILEAQSSVFTNKYAEGYPGHRYYNGCEFADQIETLAIERAKKLFGCCFVNVQPHSGSQANGAVFLALLKPGDTISGLSLSAGGHLTHGSVPSLSGKWFKAVSYGVRPDNFLLDYDQLEKIAEEHKPKLIIAGGSSYPRVIDLARIRRTADRIGAFLMFDMAHVAGLVATGLYPNPFPFAHVVTTTTHKTLKGPRGGMILTDDPEISKKINSAVFPGIQGGPLLHIIAAKAVAFGEALQENFKLYQKNVLENSKILAETLLKHGLDIVTGGTDIHLSLIDLRTKKISGKVLSETLNRVGITVNKNALPFDPMPPTVTSGIRVGSPAATTRGFDTNAFKKTGELIAIVAEMLIQNNGKEDPTLMAQVIKETEALCNRFPIYPDFSYY